LLLDVSSCVELVLKFAHSIQNPPLSRFGNERCQEIRHNDRAVQRV
jgi:hypothetical protein